LDRTHWAQLLWRSFFFGTGNTPPCCFAAAFQFSFYFFFGFFVFAFLEIADRIFTHLVWTELFPLFDVGKHGIFFSVCTFGEVVSSNGACAAFCAAVF